jgi:hypothetical protein
MLISPDDGRAGGAWRPAQRMERVDWAAPVRQSTSGGAALAHVTHFTHARRLDEAKSQKSSAAHERRRSRDYHFGSRLADMPRAPACRSSMPRAAGLE